MSIDGVAERGAASDVIESLGVSTAFVEVAVAVDADSTAARGAGASVRSAGKGAAVAPSCEKRSMIAPINNSAATGTAHAA